MATIAPARRPAHDRAADRQPRPTPHLRVVGTSRRRSKRPLMICAGLLFVFGSLLASAVFHALLAQGQQRLDRLDHRVSVAQQRYDQLRLQLDQLSAPQRIIDEATKLGMVAPADVQTITPPPGSGYDKGDRNDAAATQAAANTDYTAVKPYLGTDR